MDRSRRILVLGLGMASLAALGSKAEAFQDPVFRVTRDGGTVNLECVYVSNWAANREIPQQYSTKTEQVVRHSFIRESNSSAFGDPLTSFRDNPSFQIGSRRVGDTTVAQALCPRTPGARSPQADAALNAVAGTLLNPPYRRESTVVPGNGTVHTFSLNECERRGQSGYQMLDLVFNDANIRGSAFNVGSGGGRQAFCARARAREMEAADECFAALSQGRVPHAPVSVRQCANLGEFPEFRDRLRQAIPRDNCNASPAVAALAQDLFNSGNSTEPVRNRVAAVFQSGSGTTSRAVFDALREYTNRCLNRRGAQARPPAAAPAANVPDPICEKYAVLDPAIPADLRTSGAYPEWTTSKRDRFCRGVANWRRSFYSKCARWVDQDNFMLNNSNVMNARHNSRYYSCKCDDRIARPETGGRPVDGNIYSAGAVPGGVNVCRRIEPVGAGERVSNETRESTGAVSGAARE